MTSSNNVLGNAKRILMPIHELFVTGGYRGTVYHPNFIKRYTGMYTKGYNSTTGQHFITEEIL